MCEKIGGKTFEKSSTAKNELGSVLQKSYDVYSVQKMQRLIFNKCTAISFAILEVFRFKCNPVN
jgi:hypothetical protein